MEYVQERITTLHDFGSADPPAPTDRATVVIPMTEREHASLAAERVLSRLAAADPGRVVVALRADPDAVGSVVTWLEEFDLPVTVCWCTAPGLEARLAEVGLDGESGKGRDVWLGLGLAADSEYVVVHDADARSYDPSTVSRLLYPLANGARFSKGYYARVENDRLYGRLFRLFYTPLLAALAAHHDAPVVRYLAAFRYALAGEFAMTGEMARRVRAPRGWGLEVGTLGDAFAVAGVSDTAQVDLGVHEHDHRSVGGPEGLGEMCREVGETLFRVLADHDLDVDYDCLAATYLDEADRLIESYAADAGFNGLTYDRAAERDQVRTYRDAIQPPGPDRRLPAWREAPIDPEDVRSLSEAGIREATDH